MTVSNTTNRVAYAGNGTANPLAVAFPFQLVADLVVLETTIATGVITTKALGADYTVTGSTDSNGYYPNGGNVVPVNVVPSTVTWTIIRSPAATQTVQQIDGSPIPANSLNNPFDKLAMVDQRLADQISLAITAPDGDPPGLNVKLPSAIARASSFLGFDAFGNLLMTTLASLVASVLSAATALANLAGVNYSAQFATTSALLAAYGNGVSVPSNQLARTWGRTALGDGGGGKFYYNASDTTTADNGGTIRVDAQNRRWYAVPAPQGIVAAMFGADSTGSSDSLTAFNNAVAATASMSTPALYIGPGQYSLSGVLEVAVANLTITGSGMPRVFLANNVANGVRVIDATANGFTIRGVFVDGNMTARGATGGAAIEINGCVNFEVSGCKVISSGFDTIGTSNAASNGRIENNYIVGGSDSGIDIVSGSTDITVTGNTVVGGSTTLYPIALDSDPALVTERITVTGNTVICGAANTIGIDVEGTRNCTITGNTVYVPITGEGIKIHAEADANTVVGNVVRLASVSAKLIGIEVNNQLGQGDKFSTILAANAVYGDQAQFTASITTGTMTVSAISSGYIHNASTGATAVLFGASVPAGTIVNSQSSGTPGGIGVYVLSNAGLSLTSQAFSESSNIGFQVYSANANLTDCVGKNLAEAVHFDATPGTSSLALSMKGCRSVACGYGMRAVGTSYVDVSNVSMIDCTMENSQVKDVALDKTYNLYWRNATPFQSLASTFVGTGGIGGRVTGDFTFVQSIAGRTINSGASFTYTVSLAAALAGDFIQVTPPASASGLVCTGVCTTNGTVAITATNGTAGNITVSTDNWLIKFGP